MSCANLARHFLNRLADYFEVADDGVDSFLVDRKLFDGKASGIPENFLNCCQDVI